MREAGALINLDNTCVHYHRPDNRSGGALPDSRELWDIMWQNRKELLGFAHSHPGSGVPAPSYTDVTTFAAIESGLGRRLRWWITSRDRVVVIEWSGPDRLDYRVEECGPELTARFGWLTPLRFLSEYIEQPNSSVIAAEE